MKRLAHILDSYLYCFLLALIIIMPLHAFLTISLGQITGQQALWQAWKEVGLVIGGFAALGLIVMQPKTRVSISKQPAVWSASAFIGLAIIISALTRSVSFTSFMFGAKTTLAFLVLFIITQTISFTPKRWGTAIKGLLAISSTVGLFAVLQVYVLPADFLTRFGYGAATVLPFHLVDPAVTSIRIIGTFSGPNQLASFMIIPLILSAWLVSYKKWLALLPLTLTGFALFHSYSRSAWIGAVIAMLVIVFLRLRGWWRLALIVLLAVMAVGGVAISKASNNELSKIRYYVFHGRPLNGKIQGSDQYRLERAKESVNRIAQQPLGYGLGTAGPASKNNTEPFITENSYLQIGIETGVVGLALFVLTLVLTLVALGARFATVNEAAPLFAILIGLSATNLFLHTWADSSTALVLWGLVGYCLAAPAKLRRT